jgi:predicted 3-demethylubiquinone-9 3-methyltransferase (glyoxalase superfamily)
MSLDRHRVTPFLWYDGQAEEAARHYVSIFKQGSRVTSASPMSVTFELEGQPFIALNGGPMFKFTEALSLFVDCKDQREVDYYWQHLGQGGEPGRCGWLKDRFGLSWQIIPRALGACLGGSDRAGAQRAMEAMLGMGKLDVAKLEAAYAGKAPAKKAAKAPGKKARAGARQGSR